MGQMAGILQPYLATFGNQMNQQSFNQQLGRGASNQMYQPPSNPFASDPYTAARRPNYMAFGPNQQFYQPIYQPRYEQQVRTMDQMYQMPTYTRPLTPQPMQSQYRPIPFMNQTQIDAQQRAAKAAALAAAVTPAYDYGGGFGDASVGGPTGAPSDSGGYTGPGSVEGGGSPGGDGGIGLGAESTGVGVFAKGGKVRRPIYGGIDSLLRK